MTPRKESSRLFTRTRNTGLETQGIPPRLCLLGVGLGLLRSDLGKLMSFARTSLLDFAGLHIDPS